MKAVLAKRPHVGAAHLKYQYEVIAHSLQFVGSPPGGSVSVLWTRGSKTAITSEQTPQGRYLSFEQQLTLICTLFKEAKSADAPKFSEKLCTFAIMEQGARGMPRTVAKCKVDIAPFAAATPVATRPLELRLSKSGKHVATLYLSIGSRWLRDFQPEDDAASMSLRA